MGVNPRPGLVNDLDDWGTEALTQFLEIGTPDPKLGFDPNAYLPSSLVTVPESKRDKNAQLGMMGLASTPKYDILRLAGDEPRMRRSFVIADLKRFAKFATAMLRERDTTRTDRHAPEPELDGPTAQNALTPAGLRAFKPRNIPFGDLETMLGAMRWKGNVFSLRGGTGHDAKAPKGDLKPMLETFEDFVVDHCQANEPMRGLAPAPGLMVLDLDIPKGADEGKPDGLAVLEAWTSDWATRRWPCVPRAAAGTCTIASQTARPYRKSPTGARPRRCRTCPPTRVAYPSTRASAGAVTWSCRAAPCRTGAAGA